MSENVVPIQASFEPWVDTKAVARHFGVSVPTVKRWLRRGCPSRLIGGSRRMRITEVDAWLVQEEEGAA